MGQFPKRELTLKHFFNATEEERKTYQDGFASMQGGFTGTLDQLEAYLNKVK
jgi:hypothetical protein